MVTHSRILAWRILWTEDPGQHNPWGRSQMQLSMRTNLSLCLFAHLLLFLHHEFFAQSQGLRSSSSPPLQSWSLLKDFNTQLVACSSEGQLYYIILCKGLEHPWILLSTRVLEAIPCGYWGMTVNASLGWKVLYPSFASSVQFSHSVMSHSLPPHGL